MRDVDCGDTVTWDRDGVTYTGYIMRPGSFFTSGLTYGTLGTWTVGIETIDGQRSAGALDFIELPREQFAVTSREGRKTFWFGKSSAELLEWARNDGAEIDTVNTTSTPSRIFYPKTATGVEDDE